MAGNDEDKDLSEEINEIADELEDDQPTLEEERIQRTEDSGTDYSDYEMPDDYDIHDAYDELQEIKQTVSEEKETATEDKKKSKELEERFIDQLAKKHKFSQMTGGGSHKYHEAWVAMGAYVMISLGFLYSPWFLRLYIIGLIMLLYNDTELIKGENKGTLAKFVTNHPKFYLLGGIVSVTIFLGAGYQFPELGGWAEIAKKAVEAYLGA